MKKWEYKKVALNEVPRRGDDIDLLCDAGDAGWELVAILPNEIAYLKREIGDDVAESASPQVGASEEAGTHEPTQEAREDSGVVATVTRGSVVNAKYRDPVTGDTWSGRGRMATWLKRKQDAGEEIEDYEV